MKGSLFFSTQIGLTYFYISGVILFMNKMMRLGLFAIALTFFFGTFATTDSNAQGALNTILKKMDAHKDSLRSLEADVSMTKVDSLIGTKDEVSGKTYYLPKKGKDAYVRINWT